MPTVAGSSMWTASSNKIKSTKVTPDNFEQRFLTLTFENGSEEKVPFNEIDNFINGEMIALKEAELAEVNLLLAKCDELEITE